MRENRLVARQKRLFKRTTDGEHPWPPRGASIHRIVL
jgi:hypothetical protein